MVPQYDLLAALTAEKASRYEREAGVTRLRSQPAGVRHAAAETLRRLADRVDRGRAPIAVHGR